MKTIVIPGGEFFDEKAGKFIKINSYTLKLEHSLLSLQKWESKHHKYFLDNKDLKPYEILDYIKCMTLNQVDDDAYKYLTDENIEEIKSYIQDPMTATWFSEENKGTNGISQREIITGEVIYSSMIILGIPVELFEKRHLNHLLTLIKVCKENQDPNKGQSKMNERDLAKHYSRLNKERKAKLGTRG